MPIFYARLLPHVFQEMLRRDKRGGTGERFPGGDTTSLTNEHTLLKGKETCIFDLCAMVKVSYSYCFAY